MILSNSEILNEINRKSFSITGLSGTDPSKAPFNTSAVDLRLGHDLSVPDGNTPATIDLTKPGIATFLTSHSMAKKLTADQPFKLERFKFVLAQTLEKVDFPILVNGQCFSARVEGKSSLARCGILVHFTAPTIHSGFQGNITLEIINLGPFDFLLCPEMPICQLIIEEVKGAPVFAPNQFRGQTTPEGLKKN